jgi:hypothetical protein
LLFDDIDLPTRTDHDSRLSGTAAASSPVGASLVPGIATDHSAGFLLLFIILDLRASNGLCGAPGDTAG